MRTMPYPSKDMIKKVPKMELDEIKARNMQVWLTLTINKDLLWCEGFDYEGFDNIAPSHVTDYITALTDRAKLLGYDLAQDVERLISNEKKPEDLNPSDFEG